MKLGLKLLVAFLIVGILPAAVIEYISYANSTQALLNQTFRQLTGIREAKKQSVERYFQRVNDQITTFSRNQMVVDAMREFQPAFRSFLNENEIVDDGLSGMRERLSDYYTGDFASEFRNQNDGHEPPIDSLLEPLDNDSIALQFHYIVNNPNELGSKEVLDRAEDRSDYSDLHARIHPIVRDYLQRFGYYDVFLVDSDSGDIIYSVFKELDYSTSLIDGPYAETNFAQAFRLARESNDRDAVFLVDYETYTPSYDAPASFIASPIFDGNQHIGVAVFQMPIDRLNEIMTERSGLGESGETYLVGPDNLMRSDSFLDPVNRSVGSSFRDPASGRVETDASRGALRGESATEVIIDYNGNPVLSAYAPVNVGGFQWALIAEIDQAEALAPIAKLRDTAIIIGGAALLGILLVAFLVSRLIASPINHAITRLSAAAGRLSSASTEMIESSQGINLASVRVEESSQHLAAGAGQQSTSLSVITDNIRHINQQTRSNVETVETADDLAHRVSEITRSGVDAMQRMGQSIGGIKASSDESALIIRTMNDIAEQTNLLALNAEVAAAREGVRGRGFAVVAAEVRKLAEHSAESAHKISVFIEKSRHDANVAVQVAEEVDGLLARIADGVNQVKEINGGVATASSDQAAGIQQIGQVITELDGVTKENAAGAQQFATASTTLKSNAGMLNSQAASMQQQASQLEEIVRTLATLVGRRQI